MLWGVSAPGRCMLWGGLLWGVYARGGLLLGNVCSGGGSAPGGVSALGGCLLRGVSQHALRQTLPCEQNDRQVQKYYLGHNFVASGNEEPYRVSILLSIFHTLKTPHFCRIYVSHFEYCGLKIIRSTLDRLEFLLAFLVDKLTKWLYIQEKPICLVNL